MQVGEDPLGDALDEVMVEAEGVDADQQGDGVPGDVHQVVVAQIQVLQCLQEVLQGREDRGRDSTFNLGENKLLEHFPSRDCGNKTWYF